jgi:phosphohistidine phosphatase SixA
MTPLRAEMFFTKGRVMVVAHNPGLTDLAHHFASDITHLPTCAVVEVALAGWGCLVWGVGRSD